MDKHLSLLSQTICDHMFSDMKSDHTFHVFCFHTCPIFCLLCLLFLWYMEPLSVVSLSFLRNLVSSFSAFSFFLVLKYLMWPLPWPLPPQFFSLIIYTASSAMFSLRFHFHGVIYYFSILSLEFFGDDIVNTQLACW